MCRQYDAEQALDWGLVNAVVPLADLETETVAWCRRMLPLSPIALRMLKAGFNAADDGLAGIQQLAGDATMLFYMTEEGQEGRERLRRAPASRLLALPAPSVSGRPAVGRRAGRLGGPSRPFVLGARGHGRVPWRRRWSRWPSGLRSRGGWLRGGAQPPRQGHPGMAANVAQITWWRAAAALVVALAVQIGTNYANDYSDGVRGTDEARVGPVRLVASGLASPVR